MPIRHRREEADALSGIMLDGVKRVDLEKKDGRYVEKSAQVQN